MDTENRLDIIEDKLNRILAIYEQENWQDRMVLYRSLQLKDINQLTVLDSGVDGIKVGATGGKVALYGANPVARAGSISAPSGGVVIDSESRTAISSILTALRNINIITT